MTDGPSVFSRTRWPAFEYQGTRYTMDHLGAFEFEVVDTDRATRRILVTFSDHCFTRGPQPSDDPALAYPGSDRRPGHFDFTRHRLSQALPEHIRYLGTRSVWLIEGEHYVALPGTDDLGRRITYGIVFGLDRISGRAGVHLHMRVRSAYPVDGAPPVTYGQVRFCHLVALRMKAKRPPRMTGQHRKTPRVL